MIVAAPSIRRTWRPWAWRGVATYTTPPWFALAAASPSPRRDDAADRLRARKWRRGSLLVPAVVLPVGLPHEARSRYVITGITLASPPLAALGDGDGLRPWGSSGLAVPQIPSSSAESTASGGLPNYARERPLGSYVGQKQGRNVRNDFDVQRQRRTRNAADPGARRRGNCRVKDSDASAISAESSAHSRARSEVGRDRRLTGRVARFQARDRIVTGGEPRSSASPATTQATRRRERANAPAGLARRPDSLPSHAFRRIQTRRATPSVEASADASGHAGPMLPMSPEPEPAAPAEDTLRPEATR